MGFTKYVKGKGVYTKEEQKVGDAFCDAINRDKELKTYFAEFVTGLLKDFAAEMNKAQAAADCELVSKVANEAGDKIRAITTYLYIKVSMKKEVN